MDEIIRAVSKDGFAKISVVTARDAVQRANAIHHCSPTAIAALGRSLCAASMLWRRTRETRSRFLCFLLNLLICPVCSLR